MQMNMFTSFRIGLLFLAVLTWSVTCNPILTNCTLGHGKCPVSHLSSTDNATSVLAGGSSSTLHPRNVSTTSKPHDVKDKKHESKPGGIKIAKVDFKRVATPFVVCLWIILASLAKMAFHFSSKPSSLMPESCMLIILGIPIGLILRHVGLQTQSFYFTSNLFFFYLLPPIILDAGYFMPVRSFYLNIGTILLYATVGTIFNAFAVGASLYAVRSAVSIPYSLMHALLFGSLISAVDPVAVLAVFEEVHVHEMLYILVFGESVLNDAASVVLYHTFEAMTNMSVVSFKQVGLAFLSFFVVSIGGTCVGIVWGLATSFVTRFTQHVRVIEPIFVFIMPYMAYLTAEIFHFSGIMSILFCGIFMKPYVESNISRKSHTTVKYFLKLLSTCCETVIFMFLGASLVMDKHRWNTSFVFLTLIFISIYRGVGVVALTAIANKLGRMSKVGKTEQFIMSYGGLRGAVAFCLAILLDKKHISTELREMFITTAMVVVIFTVFVQGTTIKPLVRLLKIKRKEKQDMTMTAVINDRILDHLVAGVEEITGHYGHGYWRAVVEYYNKKYLRKWLEREPDKALDEDIMIANRKMAFKKALQMAENPSALFQQAEDLSAVKRNPSYAYALALRDNRCIDADQPQLDTKVFGEKSPEEPVDIRKNISFMIPRPRAPKLNSRSFSVHKYTLASLDEPETEIPYREWKYKRNSLAHMPRNNPSAKPCVSDKGKAHKHRHHRRRVVEKQEQELKNQSGVSIVVEASEPKLDDDIGEDYLRSTDEGITFGIDLHKDAKKMNEMDEKNDSDDTQLEPDAEIIQLQDEPVLDSRINDDEETQDDTPLLDQEMHSPHSDFTARGHQHMRSLERQDTVADEEQDDLDS